MITGYDFMFCWAVSWMIPLFNLFKDISGWMDDDDDDEGMMDG